MPCNSSLQYNRTLHECCPHRRAGFSLLELLVVLAVLLTMATLILPQLGGRRHGLLFDQTAEDVRTQLNRARLLAIDSGVVVTFECQEQGRGARVRQGSQQVAGVTDPVELPEHLYYQTDTAGAGKGDWLRVTRFQPDGTAEAARLRISDGQGRERVFLVDRATGAVRQLIVEN